MRLGHRRVHALAWALLALLLPAILVGALALRLGTPGEEAPRRLAEHDVAPQRLAPP